MDMEEKTSLSRLIYNNDGSWMFWRPSPIDVEDFVQEEIDPLIGSHIDTLVCRVDLGNLIPLYYSEVEKEFWDKTLKMEKFPTVHSWKKVEVIRNFLKKGKDPWKTVISEGHKVGLKVFGGIRMNDLHHLPGGGLDGYPTYIWVSPFLLEHPEYYINEECPAWVPPGQPCSALDFIHKEVREHRLAVIDEICRRYDFDGFEMDFLRAPHFFKKSELNEGRNVMTSFVRQVRKRLNEIGDDRSRQITLMVRVPSCLKGCWNTGLDVQRWIQERLVDIMAPSPYLFWDSPELDMPVKEFVEVAEGTGCQIFPTLEVFMPPDYGGTPAPEMYRAAANNYWMSGVDGIYFFNFHVFVNPHIERGPIDPFIRHYEDINRLFYELDDPKFIKHKDKRYVLSKPYTGAPSEHAVEGPDITYPKQLPLTLKETQGTGQIVNVTVADNLKSDVDKVDKTELRLRLFNLTKLDKIDFRFNQEPLPKERCKVYPSVLLGKSKGASPLGRSNPGFSYWLSFELDPSFVIQGKNDLEIILRQRNPYVDCDLILSDVEVIINYRKIILLTMTNR